jgi:hypothetical protein
MSDVSFDTTNVSAMVGSMLRDLRYFQGDKPAIPYVWRPGRGKLVLVLGSNAGGKSFFRRLVKAVTHKSQIECLDPSMEGRTRTGAEYGIMRALVYGDESWRATGENSAQTVLAGVQTCRGRDNMHCIFWDEPDLGLSDDWAAGMGQSIRDFAADPPELTFGIFVVTHSKALIEQLAGVDHHYLHLGSARGPKTVRGWLRQKVKPRHLEGLKVESLNRFREISAILKEKNQGR